MSWLQSPLAKAFDLDNKNYSELRQEIVSLGSFFPVSPLLGRETLFSSVRKRRYWAPASQLQYHTLQTKKQNKTPRYQR